LKKLCEEVKKEKKLSHYVILPLLSDNDHFVLWAALIQLEEGKLNFLQFGRTLTPESQEEINSIKRDIEHRLSLSTKDITPQGESKVRSKGLACAGFVVTYVEFVLSWITGAGIPKKLSRTEIQRMCYQAEETMANMRTAIATGIYTLPPKAFSTITLYYITLY